MSSADQIRKPYERSKLILVWVAISKVNQNSNINLPSFSAPPIEEHYENEIETDKFQNFGSYVIVIDRDNGRRDSNLSDPNYFEKDYNFRDFYGNLYGYGLYETDGLILQIGYRIPKRDESNFFSKSFDPNPEKGLVIMPYSIDGARYEIKQRIFLFWPSVTKDSLEKRDSIRSVEALFYNSG